MAEARRTEDEEENMRDARMDQVVRRQPRPNSSGGRPDRHKPEHRHSQGPLSSIRAAIKRTSTRSTSLSETSRERDRRRPEITILSAEPLSSISGFPGASGGIPPAPPPSARIWGPTIPPSSLQPPPSYEEVIREKSQEQVLLPPPSSSSSSSSSSKTTIATQTDTGSAPKLRPAPLKPVKPARPSFPCAPEPSHVDDITASAGQSSLGSPPDSLGASAHAAEAERTPHTHSSTHTHSSPHTHPSTSTPLSSTSGAQTDQWEPFSASVSTTPPTDPSPAPRPRPRSKPGLRPIGRRGEVKVQTLVKLREDGLATLAARKGSDLGTQEAGQQQGRYLRELLDAFSSDDWGFPEQRSDDDDGNGLSQSDSGEEDEEEMGTLKARILAFEQQQQQQQSADTGCGDANHGDGGATSEGSEEVTTPPKRPEPRPRGPRLPQGPLPTKPAPPTVAPKPSSCKGLWEEGGSPVSADYSGVSETPETSDTSTLNLNSAPHQPPTDSACSGAPNPEAVFAREPSQTGEGPSVLPPKPPPPPSETLPPGVPPAAVPVPRPPPPKATTPSASNDNSSNPSTTTTTSHRPPPRPTVAPRAGVGTLNREKSTVAGPVSPAMPPPRPPSSVEVGADTGDGAETQDDAQRQPGSNAETTHNTSNIQAVKTGSGRPVLPVKPPALTLPRRASAPSLAPKPSGPPPDPVAPKPPATQTGPPPKPPAGPTKPPSPTSAPAPSKPPAPPTAPQRKTPAVAQSKATEPSLPPRPAAAKFLPLRPPPIKNIPSRPPPPTITSTSSSATNPVPPSKLSSTPPPSSAEQPPPVKDSSAPSPTPSSQTPAPSKESPAPSPTPSSETPAPSKDSSAPSPTPSSQTPAHSKDSSAPSPTPSSQTPAHSKDISAPSPTTANQTQGQNTLKRGPPLPPRPKPGHALYSNYGKQGVLVVLDDPSPAPSSEPILSEGSGQNAVTPHVDQSQCLLDLEIQPDDPPPPEQKDQSKMAPESLSLSESQSILPEHPAGQKQPPVITPESGPRCVAKFDYEGEEDDELTFSQGDVITLLQLIGQEWARGQIHGRIGIFPLNFTEVVEPLPLQAPSPGETTNDTPAREEAGPAVCQDKTSEIEEKAIALFDFPGQAAGDLSFHKGEVINVVEHIDAEWSRGRLDGKEGVYPVAFTQPYTAQPIVGQQSEVGGVAKVLFDFTAECDDELTLKVGDVLTEVETVDEKWIMGTVGGRRGIVPKNYISVL